MPPNLRAVARYNAGWFAVEAKLLMPSLELRPLSVAAQENFHAANIGACRWGDRLIAMVRTVNWVIKDALSYEIRGGDTAWKSRLLLLELDRDLRVISSAGVDPPEDLPQLKYHIDIGFADPRPFGWRGEVWFVSTFRQLNTQGLNEIVISRVSRARPNGYVMCDWHVVPSGMQPQHEKTGCLRLSVTSCGSSTPPVSLRIPVLSSITSLLRSLRKISVADRKLCRLTKAGSL